MWDAFPSGSSGLGDEMNGGNFVGKVGDESETTFIPTFTDTSLSGWIDGGGMPGGTSSGRFWDVGQMEMRYWASSLLDTERVDPAERNEASSARLGWPART